MHQAMRETDTPPAADPEAVVRGWPDAGLYCRMSCPGPAGMTSSARRYADWVVAERDGLRPCPRCRPDAVRADGPLVARMRTACEYIEAHAERGPSLSELGGLVHLSPGWFQRRFRAIVGVTPRRYAEACRLRRLRCALRESDSVTAAIFVAGFGSTSRVYERVGAHIGMTPGAYRAGGAGAAITYATADTPLGVLLMAATDRGLCAVRLGDDADAMIEHLRAEYPAAALEAMANATDGAFGEWMRALCDHIAGIRVAPDLPTDIRATAFRTRVWDYLRRIPPGETCSYAEVATAIGRPDAARAVAGACAANPVALAIPCHRVIRGDGGLGGYRWGIERKCSILEAERARVRDAE